LAFRILEDEDFPELLAELDVHESREAEAFAVLKKTSGGDSGSLPTWPSLAAVGGATNG